MNLRNFSLILLSVIFASGSAFATQQVLMAPEKVFIPHGFDDNDNTEIVLHGHFPNTCYRAGPVAAKQEGGKIFIKNTAYFESGVPCLEMIVPWSTKISLGMLAVGSYPVVIQNSATTSATFGQVPVSKALRNTIDDQLYAYVNGVTVQQNAQRVPMITLTGSFSVSCMYLKEIKMVLSNTDVVDVLPIAAIDPSKPCAHLLVPTPFQRTVKLSQALTEKSTLFHVRSLNGQSLSYLFE